jgi:serine/threonine-protein kinase
MSEQPTSLLERLRSSLYSRYTIEREIGQGGMAHVFLAQDVKHNRQVVIEVLRPDLGASIGTERFLNRSPAR